MKPTGFSLSNELGQTLLEFAISTAIIMPLLTGAAWLLREHWVQAACARDVFEVTRTRLDGRSGFASRFRVEVTETEHWVEGSARCLKHTETVRLPRLMPLTGEP
ncbi:MAG: hypothetical protein A2X94_03070 [Bdellovibrionales bacterium GWB1_55_8]|nr:MAG: hypothetical protein A2X94_03070 [Bdellovibrionales bacterium GWB1_55_8]